MALTKIPRGLLDTGIADSSDATAITIDSSENVTFAGNILKTGNLTLDVSGTLILDSDDGDLQLRDGGTQFASLYKSSNDFIVRSMISDGDIRLQGNDGGSTITALTLDMSAAGAATFNAGATFAGNVIGSDNLYLTTNTSDGSDNKYVGLDSGGGAGSTSRGAFLGVYGNEHSSLAGDVYVMAGASGAIKFNTGSGPTERMVIASNGNVTINEALLVGTDTAYDKLAVLRTGTSQTGGMTLLNTQNGGYGSGITWESKRSDANNIQTAGRISVQGYNSWNSDGTSSSKMVFSVRHSNTLSDVISLQNGNLAFSTAGKGIDFSASAHSGGMSSEILDDYEEGTFTPTLSGCDSVSFSSAPAVYIKIGSMVHIQWYSGAFTVANAVTNSARITGLPFLPVSGKYSCADFAHTQAFSNNEVQGFTNSSNTEVYVTYEGGTNGNTWSNGYPKYVMMSCTYYVSD